MVVRRGTNRAASSIPSKPTIRSSLPIFMPCFIASRIVARAIKSLIQIITLGRGDALSTSFAAILAKRSLLSGMFQIRSSATVIFASLKAR